MKNPAITALAASLARWILGLLVGAGVLTAVQADETAVGVIGAIIAGVFSLVWSYAENKWLWKTSPPSRLPLPCIMLFLSPLLVVMMLGGCATNRQTLTKDQAQTEGGAATLNSARWDGKVYTVTGPLHPGIAELDADGASYQTGGPFSTLSARADIGTLFFGAGSDYRIGKIATVVKRKDGEETSMTGEGIEVSNSAVLQAAAKTAELLYPTLAALSRDEASVRIKQLETIGELTSASAGILRVWLGIPPVP